MVVFLPLSVNKLSWAGGGDSGGLDSALLFKHQNHQAS